jgi:hypothetical protein
MQGSKNFFFEKKKQKTFDDWAELIRHRMPMCKSFLVLFFKKELLSFLNFQCLPKPRTARNAAARSLRPWAN